MLSSKQPSLDHTEFSGFTDLSWYLDPQVTFDWVPRSRAGGTVSSCTEGPH